MSEITLQLKLELALLSYLYRFGGTIDPQTLEKHPEYFDNIAALNPNPIALGTPLDGVTYYAGHGDTKMTDELPRVIVTCAQTGGGLAYEGNEECAVEVLAMARSTDMGQQQQIHLTLRAILDEEQAQVMIVALSYSGLPVDSRAIQGFGLDGWEFEPQLTIEGRDTKKNEHGVRLNFTAVAHLE